MALFKKDPLKEEMRILALAWSECELDSAERKWYQDRYIELEKEILERRKVDHEWVPVIVKGLGTLTTGLGIWLTFFYEREHIVTGHSSKWWLGKTQ